MDYNGKDKLNRGIQMFCRAAIYYIEQSDKDSELAKRMGFAMKALSTDRKAFRLFRWIDDPWKIMAELTKDVPAERKFFEFLGKMSLLFFVIFDNAVWCASTKVIQFDAKFVKAWAGWFRFMAALFQSIAALLRLSGAKKKQAELEVAPAKDKAEEAAKASKAVTEANWNLAKMLCDFACYGPIAYDKTKTGIDFGDGWIGITGVVSSLISLRTVWKKQK